MWRYVATNDDASNEFFGKYSFDRSEGDEDEEDEWEEVEEDGESYDEDSEYDEENESRTLEGWAAIPDIILEDIFAILTPKHRHQSSMVCSRWYNMFYSPRVWERFTLLDRSFTRKKFNLYLGYQYESDPRKIQLCLSRVGSFFKTIVIPPMKDYYNLYEFLRILGYFLSFFDRNPMPHLHTFRLSFHCEFWDQHGLTIHGTGGDIWDKIQKVINNMKQLKELQLSDLLLEVKDAPNLLNAAYASSDASLRVLSLRNCTIEPFPLTQIAQFSALQKLVISPISLDDETVLLFGGTQLTEIQIVQDHLTCSCLPVSAEAWRFLKEMIPYVRIILRATGRFKGEILLQPNAPVYSVIYDNPYSQLKPSIAIQISEMYGEQLEIFAQTKLPRVHGSRSFPERADTNLLLLVKNSPRLHTLIIRQRLSTATILILLRESKNLKKLYVRQNAILKKFDWPRSPEWSADYYRWLKRTSYSWTGFVKHVSTVLGYTWRPLIDKEFRFLTLT